MRSKLALIVLIVFVMFLMVGCDELEGALNPTPEDEGELALPTLEAETDETPTVAPEVDATPTVEPADETPTVEPTETVEEIATAALEVTPEVTGTLAVTGTPELTATIVATPGPRETVTETGAATTPAATRTVAATRSAAETEQPTLATRTPAATSEVTATRRATPGAQATVTGTPQAGAAEEAPETLVLAELRSLSELDSYRSMMVMTHTSDSGLTTMISLTTEVVNGGMAGTAEEMGHWTASLVENERTTLAEFYVLGGQTWMRVNEGNWDPVPFSPDDILNQIGWLGQATDLLAEDAEGRLIREETFDGMPVWHYRFGYDDFRSPENLGRPGLFADLENAQADVWVSPEHNVIVRQRVEAVTVDEAGDSGDLIIESTVTDINEAFEIELPPELQG